MSTCAAHCGGRSSVTTPRGPDAIDAVRVGDANGPPLGASDAEIILWAEEAGRVLITLDEHTLPSHLANHLRAGRHSPGVFTIRPACNLQDILEFLVLAAIASEPVEWYDRIGYVP